MLGIGQMKCVPYGIVYGVSYCVDNGKALIREADHQERELCIKLHKLIVETHPGCFWNVFSPLVCARRSNYFMHFVHLFIECLI